MRARARASVRVRVRVADACGRASAPAPSVADAKLKMPPGIEPAALTPMLGWCSILGSVSELVSAGYLGLRTQAVVRTPRHHLGQHAHARRL